MPKISIERTHIARPNEAPTGILIDVGPGRIDFLVWGEGVRVSMRFDPREMKEHAADMIFAAGIAANMAPLPSPIQRVQS